MDRSRFRIGNGITPTRKRIRKCPSRIWQPSEVDILLKFLNKNRSFEKPTAQIYYEMFRKATKTDIPWQLIRAKVRNMRIKFNKAYDMIKDGEPMEKIVSSVCPYYYKFAEIFNQNEELDIKCNNLSKSEDSKDCDTELQMIPNDSSYSNFAYFSPSPAMLSPMGASEQLNISKPKVSRQCNDSESYLVEFIDSQNKLLDIKQRKLELEKQKLEFEREKDIRDTELRKSEIQSHERIKKMEIESSLAIRKLEMEEKILLKELETKLAVRQLENSNNS